MTGLVYKEWKQNRWFILSMILCGFAPLLVLLLLHGVIPKADNIELRIGGLIAGLLAAGALQLLVLHGDDRKLWGYWITSTSDGYKGFLRVKYEIIFAMIVLFLFSLQFVDMGYCAIGIRSDLENLQRALALPEFPQKILEQLQNPRICGPYTYLSYRFETEE